MKNNGVQAPLWLRDSHPSELVLTLYSEEGDSLVLNLDKRQHSLLRERFVREYMRLAKAERISALIDRASSFRELENIAKRYSLCDACDLSDINIYGARRTLKVIVNALERYPKLRGKLCYIGSPTSYLLRMERLARADTEVLREFNLQYICRGDIAVELGSMMRHTAEAAASRHSDYIALCVSAFGLFDAILLDENDYESYSYIGLIAGLRFNEMSGQSPRGCNTPESVVYHEIGHAMDFLCGLSSNRELLDYINTLSQSDIKKGLSAYALTSTRELIAEAFSEYTCSQSPRIIARKIGEIIERAYSQI